MGLMLFYIFYEYALYCRFIINVVVLFPMHKAATARRKILRARELISLLLIPAIFIFQTLFATSLSHSLSLSLPLHNILLSVPGFYTRSGSKFLKLILNVILLSTFMINILNPIIVSIFFKI